MPRTRHGEAGDPPRRVVGRRASTAVPAEGAALLTRKAPGPPSPTTHPPIKRTRKHNRPPSPRLLRPIGHVSTRAAYGTRKGKQTSSDENTRPISPYSKSNRTSRLGPANSKLVKSPSMSVLEKQNSKLKRELQDLKVALGAEKQNTHAFIEQNSKNMQQIQQLTKEVQLAQKQARDAKKGLATVQSSAQGISKEAQKIIDGAKREAQDARQSAMDAEKCIASLKAQHKREMEELTSKMQQKLEEAHNRLREVEEEQQYSQGDLERFKQDCERLREERDQWRSRYEDGDQCAKDMQSRIDTLKSSIVRLEADREDQNQKLQGVMEEFSSKQKIIEEMEVQARKERQLRKELHNQVQELKGNIRVYCRVRPMLTHELSSTQSRATLPTRFPDGPDQRQITLEGEHVKALDGYSNKQVKFHQFEYDRIFKPEADQKDVFEDIQQLVTSAIDGYKVSIFAYGQTGSGKTYTMQGEGGEKAGMIPRAALHLFSETNEMKSIGWSFKFSASFLEIYNEDIRDLLSSSSFSSSSSSSSSRLSSSSQSRVHNIKLVKTSYGVSTEVTGVKEVSVSSAEQLLQLVKKADENRATGSTKLNAQSSRSHSVFRLRVSGTNHETGHRTYGTLNMIDLAGSERIKKSGAEGSVQKEAVCINKSLSALGDVIMALGNKEKHVPYRNSKLTHLLQDSFGADNSKTLMFVNISPVHAHVSESLCSLRFAAKVNNCQIGTARKNLKL